MKDAWESIDKGRLHPAKEMLKKAAENVILLKQLIKDYKPAEKTDFLKMVLDQENISQNVELFLIKQDESMAIEVAGRTPHQDTLIQAFRLWKKYDSPDLAYQVIYRNITTDNIFHEVAKHEVLLKNRQIQTRLASDPRTSAEVLKKLSKMTFSKQILNRIARNANIDRDTIGILIRHSQAGSMVWKILMESRPEDISTSALEYLANMNVFPPTIPRRAKRLLAKRQGGAEKIKKDIAEAEAEIKDLEYVMEQNPNLADNMMAALTNKKAKLLALKAMLDELNIVKETSMVSGGAVHGHVDDEMNEMYSTSALSGRNYRIKISGEKEHAGHVERSQHQGLKNVIESEKTSTYRIKVLTKPKK